MCTAHGLCGWMKNTIVHESKGNCNNYNKIIYAHNIKKIKVQNHEKLTTSKFMKFEKIFKNPILNHSKVMTIHICTIIPIVP